MNKKMLLSMIFLFFIIIAGSVKEGYSNLIEKEKRGSIPEKINVPLNNIISCTNMCGPQNRCSKTGEQCTYDADCYGCITSKPAHQKEHVSIRSFNDSGKSNVDQTPSLSSLTTDIGTQADTISSLKPSTYKKGVNTWRKAFNAGQQLYDVKYNPSGQPFLMQYPERPTLSGEFYENGPLASNN
jgi:hypothetical protein